VLQVLHKADLVVAQVVTTAASTWVVEDTLAVGVEVETLTQVVEEASLLPDLLFQLLQITSVTVILQ
jgi:hypothetical protein